MEENKLDALAFEYQRDYGTARLDTDFSYLVNNPFLKGKFAIFGLSLPEKIGDLSIGEIGVFGDDAPNSPLVISDTI